MSSKKSELVAGLERGLRQRPVISKTDEAFAADGVEFVYGADGIDLAELNDLFKKGSAREPIHLQTQEILRLVVTGHTAEQIAAPALNPFMRPVVNGKLAPPRSAAVPAVIADARLSVNMAATAAAGDGTVAANKSSADAATGTLGAAGPAQEHPSSNNANIAAKTAAAAPAMHSDSSGLRAQQLPRAAQAIGGEIIKGAACGGPAGTDTPSVPAATPASARDSKNLADAASTLSPKPRPAAASADDPAGADSAAANMLTGTQEAAAAGSMEKLWTRSPRGGWVKTGRRRTGFRGDKHARAAAAATPATASAAEPGGRPKTSGVLLAERYNAAVYAATEAWYAEAVVYAARLRAQNAQQQRDEEQLLLRIHNAPYDPADWLGPYRGFIKIKVAQGPAGRSWLLACGIPKEEIPLALEGCSLCHTLMPADADLAHVPSLDYAPHMMRTMFEGLLSDWDSEGYAKTYNVPSRATLQLQLYQIWPEDKPSGWTFEKAQAAEVEEQHAEAMVMRRVILRKRAAIEDLKACRARGEPIIW